ncbi:DUF1496 domain-containing protein [Pectobacteriaceae bacterium CE70]|uniref:DUF1496 domain-containing protein n=1 Tax=Serratia sp. (strain ATCC 39006) TaxID=104623 RepID=A0A2I5TKQ2_SERS3|nr:DUF1496 domain-containing protein [Serratia sp. ATCC 39006]WJV64487.1 DUF1496 domain-containing protein [Pectobacteriaceae bacterium C52]WJV65075.1 DUF1496 domain-containing protein [Pectobacteriaceae bacterium CE70]WJY09095.1 DUF1496 domain-containing protein [Pectobacteriaceae bacterium C80]AUH00823.1 DUF1496 domain-containing protein [Serratia sp. ATCC 39006]AUH05145.1 DUF1496 domain-containing protein [Serratia sp. ATCC 39006]
MRRFIFLFVVGAAAMLPSLVQANQTGQTNTDIVVPVPPQVVWGNGNSTSREVPTNCMSCCIYQNKSYSEGAVLKAEGVLLQCVRDKQSLGTNNLIWQIVK